MSEVLIPTDFSANSLKQLDTFIQNYEGEGFECVLMFSDFNRRFNYRLTAL
jgi:hypothetical protein